VQGLDSKYIQLWLTPGATVFTLFMFSAGITDFPCVKPDLDFDPMESIFSNLDWNLDSEPAIVEDTYESYENLTFTGSQLEGWDFAYSLVNTFEIEISSESLEDAEQLLRESVQKYLAIFDSAVEETLEIEIVRLVHQK